MIVLQIELSIVDRAHCVAYKETHPFDKSIAIWSTSHERTAIEFCIGSLSLDELTAAKRGCCWPFLSRHCITSAGLLSVDACDV